MKLSTIAMLLCVLALPAAAEDDEHEGDIARVVEHHYPADLAAYTKRRPFTEKRQQAFMQVEIADAKYVVAVYSDGHLGAAVLLRQTSESSYVTEQEIVGHMQGTDPTVRAIDMDGDHIPEAVVSFRLPRGGETLIFRITNHRLELISPTMDEDGVTAELRYPVILDLGNQAKELIDVFSSRDPEDTTVTYYHYVLRAGKYARTTPLDFYEVFYRTDGERNTQTARFSIAPSLIGKPFKMIIVNGDSSTREFRVEKAVITLNGVKLTSKDDFSEDRGPWTVPVALTQDNTISVELRGNSRGRIGIVVQH